MKQDSKRISLKQPYETDYLLKVTRSLIKSFEIHKSEGNSKVCLDGKDYADKDISVNQILKVLKATEMLLEKRY